MQIDTCNHANANSKTTLSIAQQTHHNILKQLFGLTLKVALVHAIASLLILFWLAKVADLTELTVWFCIVTFVSCARLFLYAAYTKYYSRKNSHFWLHAWAGCSAIMGSVYGIALVYFTPFEQAEYAMAVGLFIVGLSAVSVMIHGASVYAVLSFLVPIMLIPSYFLIAHGGDSGMMTMLIMGFYSFAVLVLIHNISTAFKKSVLLGLQHQQEHEKRKQVEQQLQDISRRDGLTGKFNRRYFDEMIEAEIGRAHRNHSPLCMLMFDVDYFKQYNQEHGYIAGDNCLVNIADIAGALVNRKGDLMARYTGEKFAIILPNIDLKGAIAFANKLQQAIQNRHIPHATSKLAASKCVTISIGVTNLMPFTKVKPKDLIKYAENALFEAKRQGRNRVHFRDNSGLNQGASL